MKLFSSSRQGSPRERRKGTAMLLGLAAFSLASLLVFGHSLRSDLFIPKSDLIRKSLSLVKTQYVDPERVIPQKMLQEALDSVALRLPPVLASSSVEGERFTVQITMNENTQSFTFARIADLDDLEEALQTLQRHIKKELDLDDLKTLNSVDYALINGFLSTLDPHTSLLEPQTYSSFTTNTLGNFGGVGIVINVIDGDLTAERVLEGGPADRAGLKDKDIITQIGDKSAVNIDVRDAQRLLKGKPGTKVTILVRRKGLAQLKEITITRRIIELSSVASAVIDRDGSQVGYLKLQQFAQNTYESMNKAIAEMQIDLSSFRGLILDLRGNGGGLLDQAIRISDRFLGEGDIVFIATANKKVTDSYSARSYNSITTIPILVLIDGSSASASEILAAALKKNKRAVVLGEYTFGKGSVQSLSELRPEVGIKLTTSQYLTPGKQSIQQVGVAPDVLLQNYVVSEDYFLLFPPPNEYGEAALEQTISQWAGDFEYQKASLFHLYSEDEDDYDVQKANFDEYLGKVDSGRLKSDFLLRSATDILMNLNTTGYDSLLEKSLRYVQQQNGIEREKLVKKINSVGARWEAVAGFNAKNTTMRTKIWLESTPETEGQENSGSKENKDTLWQELNPAAVPNRVKARIYIAVTNTSKQEIPKLTAVLNDDDGFFENQQLLFGNLKPGETRKWYIPFRLQGRRTARNIELQVNYKSGEKDGVIDLFTERFDFNIIEQPTPRFTYQIDFQETNFADNTRNGKHESGEEWEARINITNTSDASTGPLRLDFKSGELEGVYLLEPPKTLEDGLQAKETQQIAFRYLVKQPPVDGELDFLLQIFAPHFPINRIQQEITVPFDSINYSLSNAPPDISLDPWQFTTDAAEYTLKGRVHDSGALKDVYAFLNNKKIFYRNLTDIEAGGAYPLRLDLQLQDGINDVVIITRDAPNSTTTRRHMQIRKTSPKTAGQ